ncbi:MAG: type I-B CRISPR-associated endonuclease Cas1b [Bacteroidota bacterium]|nr:type I-B CRISPR-associated endonuclease Cas1b [Bacteroidota bacterium]
MKKTYYLFNPGRLSRKDNTLKFIPVDKEGKEQKPKYLPVENVEDLYIFGSLDANSSFYNFLGKNQISVHFFDYYENYTGSFMPKDQLLAGKVILSQTKHYQNKNKRIIIARKFIESASYNMLKNLKYYNNRGKDLESIINSIQQLQLSIPKTKRIDELMGIEGNIRRYYYQAFDLIINDFKMGTRTKQPPLNEVNALISFGNMMCYAECLRSINKTQLNPTISYLHEPGERRYSLALDIAEIFKPIIVDRVIFKVLNKKEITINDFDKKLNKILLKDKGKKTFIKALENKYNETIKHRTLNKSVSYKHLIKLECYKLLKHLLEIEEYKPLKMWW